MTDPISFPSTSPRFALPLLFPGQSQKEFFVNEAFARADMLLHAAVLGETDDPPATPAEGDCWLVGNAPSGEWADRPGALASRQDGTWLFASGTPGMRVHDRATGQTLVFSDGWVRIATPLPPTGGSVIDSEARDTIATLIEALQSAGIFASA